MGPTWGPSGPCRPQMGPMLAPWTLFSRTLYLGSDPRGLGVKQKKYGSHKIFHVYRIDNFVVTYFCYISVVTGQRVNILWWQIYTSCHYSHCIHVFLLYACNFFVIYCTSQENHHSSHFVVLSSLFSLQWRHNECDGVSNHQPHGWLLSRLFRRRSKKTSKLRITDLC